MEKMVEGLFGRAFKSSVQPVELAHKLAKEMSDHKTVSVSRIYVPNEYEVYLSPGDYEQLSSFEGPLVEDLASYLVAYANRESWTLVATPTITLHSDDDLALGEFGIATHMGAQAVPEAGVALAPPPVGTVAKPPAGLSQTIVFQPPAAGAAPAAAPRLCGVLVRGDRVYVSTERSRCSAAAASATSSSTTRTCRAATPRCRREGGGYVLVDLDSTNGITRQRAGGETRRARRGRSVAARHHRPALRESTVLDVILFALKIAFLVLLFLFVFFVVRRTVRDVSSDAARPAAPPAPREAAPSAPPAAAPAPVVAAVPERARSHAGRAPPAP